MEQPFGFGLRVRNVNEALANGMELIKDHGVRTNSRGLDVLRAPGPVTTVYDNPLERVLFCPVRDANPFFHMMESMWIIGGSNRVELPEHFLPRYAQYSDDGQHLHGAYGYRLRRAHGFDQIEMACAMLKDKPDSRQVVMSIWHPQLDLATKTADMPCNDMVMLDIVDGALNMTVCNRSNDVIWGAYGANAVQFSYLLEYMAACVGVRVGQYVQQSNNYHIYTDNPYWLTYTSEASCAPAITYDEYTRNDIKPLPMCEQSLDARDVYHDCVALCRYFQDGDHEFTSYGSVYFGEVVVPALKAHAQYRKQDYVKAAETLTLVAAADWRIAMTEWVTRRHDAHIRKAMAA